MARDRELEFTIKFHLAHTGRTHYEEALDYGRVRRSYEALGYFFTGDEQEAKAYIGGAAKQISPAQVERERKRLLKRYENYGQAVTINPDGSLSVVKPTITVLEAEPRE